MPKQVKLADIAEKAGVSVVTVSKALADKNGVSEENREKIKGIARDLGYLSPADNTTGTIGVIIPDRYIEIGNSFY